MANLWGRHEEMAAEAGLLPLKSGGNAEPGTALSTMSRQVVATEIYRSEISDICQSF
jgi:hypothetical protein